MLTRTFENLLLRPEDLPPSRDDLEVIGVFNPGAVRIGQEVVLLVRVAERPRERRPGFSALPRWDPGAGLVVDWVPNAELEPLDPRVVRRTADGLKRLTFISHLRLVRLGDGRAVTGLTEVSFHPQEEWEEFGVEDPRITRIGDRFYFTYVAVSRHGAATALASTSDFRSFKRHGIIFPCENKDVVLFPEPIGGKYVGIHRPNPATLFAPPEMWIARSPDLAHWGQHATLFGGAETWEAGRIGAGPPPLRVDDGWLLMYHGNRKPERPGEVGEYVAAALLLDADDPSRIVRRSREPILVPEADFERQGFVGNVVFPTGIVEADDRLLVYYGASDSFTAVVEVARDELLAAVV
jgi:predicted GH43/DUF377 family glycosyl hydrolase